MDLNARVEVNFARVDINLKGSFYLILLHFFFHFDINTKVPLILHTIFKSNIPRHFGEMD